MTDIGSPYEQRQDEAASHPLTVRGRLDAPGHWLWLIKWLLAIPHYIVLFFLWIAFMISTVIAFFAILFTGRYPRTLFDFAVGVLRWNWRVSFYSYGVLGTDKYPPFTLAEVADYPAGLSLRYPEKLSRGLVLVKWWLLAIPHYLVLAAFSGGVYLASQSGNNANRPEAIGLIGVLVLITAVALLFTGRYPKGIFDFLMGVQRWGLRLVCYAALLTDVYPPFRLDQGGSEPAVDQHPVGPQPGYPARTA